MSKWFGRDNSNTGGGDALAEKGTNERVVVNVGGKRFETTVDTFTTHKRTLLGSLFSAEHKQIRMDKTDSHGEIFFDRDPRAFKSILNFYRTGELIQPPELSREQWRAELKFFRMTSVDKTGSKLRDMSIDSAINQNRGLLEKVQQLLTQKGEEAASKGRQEVRMAFVQESFKGQSAGLERVAHVIVKNTPLFDFLSSDSNMKLIMHILRQEHMEVAAALASVPIGRKGDTEEVPIIKLKLWDVDLSGKK